MNSKSKKLVIVISVIVIIGFSVYWAGITSPKKEVILKKKMIEDIYTHEIIPSYQVYYKWDGKEQTEPWWIIIKTYKTHGKWKVIEFKDLQRAKSAEDFPEFDSKWISDYKFSPQPTRYQTILLLLTAQPTFQEEQEVFFKILDEIKIQ